MSQPDMKPGDVCLFDRVRRRLDTRRPLFIDHKANEGHSMVMLFLGTMPLYARKADPEGFGRLRSLGWMPQQEALTGLKRAMGNLRADDVANLPIPEELKELLTKALDS